MPAANIMATQEMVRNSGFSPSFPSGMLPNFPRASHRTKTTNSEARTMKSQPVYSMTQSSALCEVAERLSAPTNPQITKATANAPVIPKVALSSVSLRFRRTVTACSVLV